MKRRVIYFASGSNHPGEIRGFAELGHPVGVSAPHIYAAAEAELRRLAGSGLPVFIDSGAFSEIAFDRQGRPQIVPGKVITPQEWERRLSLYERLTRALRGQAWCVAPDRVGDQEHTLGLLQTWGAALRQLAHLGGEILVPLQRGGLSTTELHEHVDVLLGGLDWAPAIPSKKAASPTRSRSRSGPTSRSAARWSSTIHTGGSPSRPASTSFTSAGAR